MDMYELTEKRYDYFAGSGSLSGMDWLKRFKEQYDHLIWLNPEEPPLRRLLGSELRPHRAAH